MSLGSERGVKLRNCAHGQGVRWSKWGLGVNTRGPVCEFRSGRERVRIGHCAQRDGVR